MDKVPDPHLNLLWEMVGEHPFSMEHDARFKAILGDLYPQGERHWVAFYPAGTGCLLSRRHVSAP